MNIQLFTLAFLIMGSQFSFGQEINIYKTFGGYRFERDSVSISPSMVLKYMKDNPQAYAEFKRAKANYNAAGILGFAGGIMIAVPIVSAIGGGNPEWGLAAGGFGLILASLPLTSAFRQHTLNALDTYNSNPSSSRRIKVDFSLAGAGGKLIIRF